jgi:hypothetical protein
MVDQGHAAPTGIGLLKSQFLQHPKAAAILDTFVIPYAK